MRNIDRAAIEQFLNLGSQFLQWKQIEGVAAQTLAGMPRQKPYVQDHAREKWLTSIRDAHEKQMNAIYGEGGTRNRPKPPCILSNGIALAEAMETNGHDSTDLLGVIDCLHGGGGPDNVFPHWKNLKIQLQRLMMKMASKPDAAQGKKRRRRQSLDSQPKPLTPRQTEVLQIFGECKGDIAKTARNMGLSYKTTKQHLDAAHKKLGRSGVRSPQKTVQLPRDRRGNESVTDGDNRRFR